MDLGPSATRHITVPLLIADALVSAALLAFAAHILHAVRGHQDELGAKFFDFLAIFFGAPGALGMAVVLGALVSDAIARRGGAPAFSSALPFALALAAAMLELVPIVLAVPFVIY